MSKINRVLVVLAGLLVLSSLFVPLWKIELDAPQYPEGLELLIYPNRIGGQVDVVNGLNHYIGMKTLHTEDFVEFAVLPYIIGGLGFFFLFIGFRLSRKWLSVGLVVFILFGIISMVDFWKWEYDYGHNLDPNAAIKVPGMTYQPPLIGFKQLLNFGAYSIPHLGGWLFIAAGILLVFAWFNGKKVSKFPMSPYVLLVLVSFFACSPKEPKEIQYNVDVCAYCQMTITDPAYGCELITAKGKIYVFDEFACMERFEKELGKNNTDAKYVANFLPPHQLLLTDSAVFLKNDFFRGPMNGNIAAFENTEASKAFADQYLRNNN